MQRVSTKKTAGQPCSNCSRRFPQPICEYKPITTRRAGGSDSPITPTDGSNPFRSPIIQDDSLDFFNLSQQPILPVRPVTYDWIGCEPDATQLWNQRQCSGLEAMDLVQWSGTDVLTQFPSPGRWDALPWTSAPGSPPQSSIRLCNVNCEIHSRPENGASGLLQARNTTFNRPIDASWDRQRTEDTVTWLLALEARARDFALSPQPRGTTQALSSLPVPPTQQHTELLRTFVKLASSFRSCIDGNNQDATNSRIELCMPFCVRTPLLAQVAIYTASCFLVETGALDKTVAMAHKGLAIRMLNELLRSTSDSTSDEAIAAVVQMILGEWYWGDSSNDLQAHLRGLREMIRLRGGIHNLGMEGFVGKLVVVVDCVIALSLEQPPFLSIENIQDGIPGGAGEQSQAAYDTPFAASSLSFSACSDILGFHPVTASILDDIRFLISTVLDMPSKPSLVELNKLKSTASWTCDRISRLHPDLPRDGSPQEPENHALAGIARGAKLDRKHSPERDPATLGYYSNADGVGISGIPGLPRRRTAPPTTLGSETPADPPSSDSIYQVVRQTALVYCQAAAATTTTITTTPFSAAVGAQDLSRLWTAVRRVPLAQWRRVLGVFGWVLAAVAPSARGTPHDRLAKSLFTTWGVQMALDDWAATTAALRGALRLQARLLHRAGPSRAVHGEGVFVKLEPGV
ncbi:hypothetical protein PpBr36_01535 [Pyricularia pennisetigena]|uniref:hypothetical protein n=1 Tax=Pyricularia pennisetigena TaxID=1578925 RepID=UPI0011549517|nr:hypothetical protein PpBr36_01535 [Pyricularia pennisetigena]TLS28232.1 hypothetical protein PpBr36_01535 [Pyricularia pennisetigena]